MTVAAQFEVEAGSYQFGRFENLMPSKRRRVGPFVFTLTPSLLACQKKVPPAKCSSPSLLPIPAFDLALIIKRCDRPTSRHLSAFPEVYK